MPPLQTRQLGVREDCPRLAPPARLAQVAAEQGREVEGGGGVQEERVRRVGLVEERIGGQGQMGQVGRQGGVGSLRQAPGKAPFLMFLSFDILHDEAYNKCLMLRVLLQGSSEA